MMLSNKSCRSCQHSIPSEAQFCPFCGHSFIESIPEEQEFPVNQPSGSATCPNCGTVCVFPIPAYCGTCGYTLSQPEAISEPIEEIPEPFLVSPPPPIFKDNTNNVPDQVVRNTVKDSEKPHFNQNIYFAAAAVIGVFILLGVLLVGGMALLQMNSRTEQATAIPTLDINAAYTSAMQTTQAKITQAALFTPTIPPTEASIFPLTFTPTSLPTAEPTLSPTFTLTLVPLDTPTSVIDSSTLTKEVESFIYYYWALINKKDFGTAWLYQTPRFQKDFNQGDQDNFVEGFKYVKNVFVTWVGVVAVSEYDATVDANIQIITTNGDAVNAYHRYALVKQDNFWLIDTAFNR